MPTATLVDPLPLVRADGRGYSYAGESVDGFADREELPTEARVRLARLAERYMPKRLTPAQRELLASPLAERDASKRPSVAQEGFQADEQEAARAWEDGVYAELPPKQREWVAQPGRHPKLAANVRYPLTLGQLHRLTGASERQLRHWTDAGLIPSHRAGAHRRFYSAAAARALLLAQMTPQQLASLITLRQGGQSGRRLTVLIGSVLASLAESADIGEPQRTELLEGARTLVDHREVFAGNSVRPARSASRVA